MNRVVFLLLFLLGCIGFANAQQLVITVVEQNSGATLPAMMVKVGEVKGLTDMDGVLAVTVASYPLLIEVSGLGFETITKKISKPGNIKLAIARQLNAINETIVTGVSRPMQLQNALSNYTVINRTAIDAMGAVTLNDALPTQLNMNMTEDAMLGTNLRMQQLMSDKVKVLVDGMPVNGREGGSIDLGQLNLNNIERIEIVKGPMSVVYGSDAVGGVINLISRKRSAPWTFDATGQYESAGKYVFNGSGSYKVKRHQLSVGGGRNYFQGWGDLDTGAVKRALAFKPKEQYLANGSYNYVAPSGFKAQLASDFVKEKVTNRSTASITPYSALGDDQYYRTTRSLNRLSFEGNVGKKGHYSFQNSYAYYKRVRESVIKDLVTLVETPSASIGVQDTSVFKDISMRSNYSSNYKRLRYDGGYDIVLQTANSLKFAGSKPKSQDDYAVYANFSSDFLKDDKLTIQLGLRGAYNTRYNVPGTGALNFLYRPAKQMQVRASFAKAFRAPSLKEMYLEFIDLNHRIIGNPDLKPEEGNHIQLSVSHQYQLREMRGQVVFSGNYNDVNNLITLFPVGPDPNTINYTYANIAHISNVVFTFQTDVDYKNLFVTPGISFTQTFKEKEGTNGFGVFEANLNGRYLFKKPKVSLSVFYKYTGRSKSASSMPTRNEIFGADLAAFHTLNASVERSFWNRRLHLIVGMKNILDTRNTLVATAASGSSSGHSGAAGGNSFLPRSVFTTLKVNLQ